MQTNFDGGNEKILNLSQKGGHVSGISIVLVEFDISLYHIYRSAGQTDPHMYFNYVCLLWQCFELKYKKSGLDPEKAPHEAVEPER